MKIRVKNVNQKDHKYMTTRISICVHMKRFIIAHAEYSRDIVTNIFASNASLFLEITNRLRRSATTAAGTWE